MTLLKTLAALIVIISLGAVILFVDFTVKTFALRQRDEKSG